MRRVGVIVGSSVGGVRTAQALRTAGYDGDVVLVGEESALPYDKPPLSKAMLTGATTAGAITLLTEQAAADAGIRLLLGRRAVQLHVDEQAVELDGGERLAYDDVVIATGARARTSPWGEPPGVHVLRTLDDAIALGADLRRGGPLVVIGAGFVGAEVAATARGMGVEHVTVVDPVPVPLSRVLNPAVAQRFATLHADRGVDTRFGVGVAGIGAVPNDEWLRSSGLQIDDGVVCDEYSRAVGAPHVYAVGDVARWFHRRHGRLVRVEHWTNAVEQAACVAHNIVHADAPRAHEPVEYVWSDQYDWKIQLAGRTGGDLDHITVQGADPERSFAVLYADPDGGFAGAVTVNWPRALISCRRSLGAASTLEEVRGSVQGLVKRARTALRG